LGSTATGLLRLEPTPTATEVDTAARERATEIRSFDLGVPQEELEDLRRRFAEHAYSNS
jgi:hypothetical protein